MTREQFWDKWKYGFREGRGTLFQQQRRHDVAKIKFMHDLDEVIEGAPFKFLGMSITPSQPEPEMRCIVCGMPGPPKTSKEADAWDWFTGTLKETVHFCPQHNRSSEWERLWKLSRDSKESTAKV